MDPPSAPSTNGTTNLTPVASNSQTSETSQTAQDYIASQLSLEAEAREALPYQFDTCTKPLGPLRQSVYACLTCTPPPASPHQKFAPAGVCYSCSISCHGEHNLVELFSKRDFECDCGTTRFSNSGTACNLRLNEATGRKGGVTGEKAREGNKYNQNFEGKFCGCGEEYDPEMEKGTMFQCLGLGTVEDGGCGEDWWHAGCLMGLSRDKSEAKARHNADGALETVKGESDEGAMNGVADVNGHEDTAVPPGFPDEDDFDLLICYKCVNAFPWIRQYAGSPGFLVAGNITIPALPQTNGDDGTTSPSPNDLAEHSEGKKRKAEDDLDSDFQGVKKSKHESSSSTEDQEQPTPPATNGHTDAAIPAPPKHTLLPPAPTSDYTTLFLKEDFRDHLCRCPDCFPRLAKHRQLLEEEDTYEPPVSESESEGAAPSVNSGSLYSRGEAALSSIDRVRAIEGVMAYNHVKDKVKAFLKPYAESGQVVGAEDIKAYFARLRGDEAAEREVGSNAAGEGGGEKDFRREQGGY